MSDTPFVSALMTWFLALSFAGTGLFNLVSPAGGRWHLSPSLRYVPSIGLIMAAILLASPSYHWVGAALAAFALFAVIVTFLGRSAYTAALIGILLLGALWARVLLGPF